MEADKKDIRKFPGHFFGNIYSEDREKERKSMQQARSNFYVMRATSAKFCLDAS
jgi:hypothetical protein